MLFDNCNVLIDYIRKIVNKEEYILGELLSTEIY